MERSSTVRDVTIRSLIITFYPPVLHWEVPGFKRGPGRPRTNWRNHLGGSRGGSSEQIRMASECGPMSVLYKILLKSISITNYELHFQIVFQIVFSVTLEK